MYSEYAVFSDEELIEMMRQGNDDIQDFIIYKYKNLVRVKASAYFIAGADKDDIIQEGMIGLFKAIRDYKRDKQSSFYYFADMCITRQIISAIKASTRQKHIPYNLYVSLNNSLSGDDTDSNYMKLLAEDSTVNPEEVLISREDKLYIETHMERELSNLESKVLALHLKGNSYIDIAKIIEKDEKAIDNALQRVRKKVSKILAKKNVTV